MSPQLQSFAHLLKLFETVPKSRREQTFMEVAGYPHYENVCSNILAFYLDANGEHKMGTLMLESLFDLAPEQTSPIDLESFNIEREYTTPKNQRIDLVLEGGTHVIAIENKVYHWLANDLSHYSETVESLAGPKRKTIKFVLSPAKITEPLDHGFISITYRELWERVQDRLGNHLRTANPKWLTFLIDFIETSDRFIPTEKMELTESDRFIIEHDADINALVAERTQFQKKLISQANHLHASLTELPDKPFSEVWTYQKTSVIMEFELCGHRVAFDQSIHPEGWFMGIIGRSPEANAFLKKILPSWKTEMKLQNTDVHVSFHKWPLETEIDELAKAAKEALDDLIKHSPPFSSPEN